MELKKSINRAVKALKNLQLEDGHFEGRLSSNTYPTCAYALIQLLQGKKLEQNLVNWFLAMQSQDGLWKLDLSDRTDQEATALVKLILEQIGPKNSQIIDALNKSPEIQPNSWMTKVFYALCEKYDWNELVSSKMLLYPMKIMLPLMQMLPESLRAKLKPAEQTNAPPIEIFTSSLFNKLFIAEQFTLVPIFLIIELNTKKRKEIINGLLKWLKNNVLSDGSWFRVGYITGVSVLSLIDAQKHGFGDKTTELMIQKGIQWLESNKNPDGGIREAVNLNVWDTALSIVSLVHYGISPEHQSVKKACQWLIDVQNEDGGWAFSGMKNGNLPSDADDTALSTLALLRSQIPQNHLSITKAIQWLKKHQAKNGSWGTYIPGQGDVGCVSITSHVIEASLEIDGFEKEREKAVKWLKKKFTITQNQDTEKTGYWNDLWLAKKTYGTASAIAALLKSGEKSEVVSQGVNWLHSSQNPDGGWGEDMFGESTDSTAEQTAWSTYALLLTNTNDKAAERGINWLLENQNEDGTWAPNCVGIYWEVLGGYADPIYALVFPLLALKEKAKE